MEEPQLIAALKRSEAAAFSYLVHNYQQLVYRAAFQLLQQQEDAADVTQEVFMIVFHSVKDFRGDARLSTWLYRITVRKAIEWQRKKQRKKRFGSMAPIEDAALPAPATHQHPGERLEQKEQAAVLFAAIERLPQQQRVAFLLSESEQLSQAEIAAVMKTSISSVESLLFRGRKKLRSLLSSYYDTMKQ